MLIKVFIAALIYIMLWPVAYVLVDKLQHNQYPWSK